MIYIDMKLYDLVNYRAPYKYLVNSYIREYDLSKANINSLLFTGRISQEQYLNLLALPKQDREVAVGLMIRDDRTIYDSIQVGIKEAKKRLFLSNDIRDYEVNSIRNDAVFVSNRDLKNVVFPPFEFKVKSIYNIYFQLLNLDVYYRDSIDINTGSVDTTIDVKGISDDILQRHQNGMLDIICETCYRIQRESPTETLRWITGIYNDFINLKMGVNFYRNFDSYSEFTINSIYLTTSIPEVSKDSKPLICIDRNLSIFRELIFIISDIARKRIG